MKNDETQTILDRFPRLVKAGTSFECDSGWLGILEQYFADVEKALPSDAGFNIDQIKEKYGLLILDTNPTGKVSDEVLAALSTAEFLAENRSAHTCESCGKPGHLVQSGNSYFVACEDHKSDGVPTKPEHYVREIGGRQWIYDQASDAVIEYHGEPDGG
ncbi:hypothetical protein [Mesorhizobium sp. A623]